jgi:precorrin-2 dehydrogenase/sirohydrochlorin ferrochelatase
VNPPVAEAARRQGTLVNVVDSPETCDFLVPSVLRRGPLCISVSTSGASPALAKSLREELQRLYGPSFGQGLSWLSRLRGRLLTSPLPTAKRREALKRLAGPRMLDLLRRDLREFRRQSTRLVSKYLSPLGKDRAKG